MACECDIVGLLNSNYEGIISASLNGSTTIEIAEDGTILLGSSVNNLSISAYAFPRGGDKYLGATCRASASASIPWVTKYDCFADKTYFIPKAGGKASITNGPIDNVSLECAPGIFSDTFEANANNGPASPIVQDQREEGFNLIYNGHPLQVETGKPKVYTINLGFTGQVEAYLQSFQLTVDPPDVARVSYSFVFSG